MGLYGFIWVYMGLYGFNQNVLGHRVVNFLYVSSGDLKKIAMFDETRRYW